MFTLGTRASHRHTAAYGDTVYRVWILTICRYTELGWEWSVHSVQDTAEVSPGILIMKCRE